MNNGVRYENEYIFAKRILRAIDVENEENALKPRTLSIGFSSANLFTLKKGGELLLDFGKEICGGLRLLVRYALTPVKVRIIFGESVSEALSSIGEKGATNDHAMRDFAVELPNMSDSLAGNTGFRFARIILVEGESCAFSAIVARSVMPVLEKQGEIKTDNELLNNVISVAAHTLKLNMQNGFIWDGIKRDRLVWCGDLNPEEIAGLEYYNNFKSVANAMSVLIEDSNGGVWVNGIPSYSAWYIINYCDALRLGVEFSDIDRKLCTDFIEKILKITDESIDENGKMTFKDAGMHFYLDWPTYETPDAEVGTASLFILAAKRYLEFANNAHANSIIQKLERYLDEDVKCKQTKAVQILAGRKIKPEDKAFLEDGGAKGLSTFMGYYILTAYEMAGGKKALDLIEEYYGAMLKMGATSFWEDFDIEWVENAFRIDEMPVAGKIDIHGDYGKYCYKGLRHSLCHGWAGGVLGFIIERIIGLNICNGYQNIKVCKNDYLANFSAKLPTPFGYVTIVKTDGHIAVDAPEKIDVVIE